MNSVGRLLVERRQCYHRLHRSNCVTEKLQRCWETADLWQWDEHGFIPLNLAKVKLDMTSTYLMWCFHSIPSSSVIRGLGEVDVYNNYMNSMSNTMPVTPKTAHSDRTTTTTTSHLEHDDQPYLIVDLRDQDEFRANHIVSGNIPCSSRTEWRACLFAALAHHYPAAMLSRCTNNESRELLTYVNLSSFVSSSIY